MKKEFLDAYTSHANAIYRHCYFRVYNKQKAEELVQETFLKTWDYIRNGKEVDNLRAFLYRVATNLVIDYSRKSKEHSLEDILADAPALQPAIDGETHIESKASLQEALKAIEQLKEKDRNLITMRYIEGLAPREIAGILKITPNQVSVGINRAVKKLENILNPTD